MLRRGDELAEAVALIKTIPQLDRSHDLDEWWIERRVLARKLLDDGNPKDAYAVVRDATPPDSPNYRSEHQFMAGWIALRYLHDPSTAYAHFSKIAESAENPISIARGAYWTGRAAEALHKNQEAKQRYQEAARYPTAYYGQIARAKAGLGELALNPFPALSSADRNKAMSSDIVRAAELLYAVEARDLVWTMMADLGDKSNDVGVLAVMSELTAKYRDARGMLLLGKLALARGYPLEHAAFPTIGVPDYTPIGPPVDPALVYSIVRQESWFNPKTVSTANALGLMQVTPAAGKYIAGKFKATFDQKRLLSDMPYNVQFGSAELGDVDQGLSRLLHHGVRRLQRRPRPLEGMARKIRRPARSQGRSDRLGGAHPVLGDAQLRAARHGERAGLSPPLRRQLPPADRGRSAPRQRSQLIRTADLGHSRVRAHRSRWPRLAFSCKMTGLRIGQWGRKVHGGQRHRRRRGEQRFRHRPRWP